MFDNFGQLLLSGNNLAYASISLLGICLFGFVIFESTKYWHNKRRNIPYNGLKFTTKNIGYIAMMIAVSVSVTVVISITLPVTVFPPIRVAFTGIMIKITGLFFGPIVGIIVGLSTEMLCLMFVPSYIHIAYFFVSIGFGFWAGISSYTTKLKNKNRWITFGLINAYTIGFTIMMYFITSSLGEASAIFGIQIAADILPLVFVIFMAVTLVIIWVLTFTLEILKKTKWLEYVLPVILLCIITETLCTLLIASWGDSGFLGLPANSNGYMSMVVTRLLMVPVKIIFNTTVLTTVTVVLRPLVKQN
ncbi:hypothetical protein ESOMN_v1c06960 [Williamsoniiplasma somnilux]|uniref:ECF transporter S component n=1 Tax=Williamsoniiplasma somnilux TaxID=215578 RepID=A0A2K8P0W6_9MOLU|nr:ECF transporter S component [Williamsoniiplasma somnilux]ATZ19078.1 hypothetical protein ESOMN_v1c06960 [Williamsoniiplasma somnilux]